MQRAVFIVMIFALFTLVELNLTSEVDEVLTENVSSSTKSFFTSNVTDADNFTSEIVTIASLSDNETSCDVNSTNCTTLTTKESPRDKKSTVNDNEIFKLTQEIKEFSSKYICSCDLQLQTCDINCCCDKDCSYENKLVFEKCDTDENRIYDTSYCKYTKYIYKNNTPYEWEVTQNGLFCIEKSNLPASYSIHKELNLKSLEEAHLQKSKKYSWSSVELNKTDIVFSPPTSRFYYGQIVWILKNHSVLQPLEIPSSFVTSACLTKKTVKFLENFKTKCTHTMITEHNNLLSLENFIQNITVISQPELINSTWNETHFMSCPKNVCVPLEVKICEKNLEKCSVPTHIDKFKFACHFSLYNNEKFCINMVHMVKYNFYHNGTRGISKAESFIVLESVTFQLNRNFLYLQKFEVNYLWINHTLNYSLIRSGNPGYIIEKPILITNFITMRNSSNSSVSNFTETLHRNYLDFTDNFMTFPTNVKGLCVLTNSTNAPIEFGYNMIVKCKLKKQIEFEANLTATNMCRQLQMSIFNYWSIKVGNKTANFTKLVGKFGNANASDAKDWMPVSYSIQPAEVLNYTSGQLNNKSTKLSCNGIYTHLKVDFYHGREVVADVHNQEKLLWTTFQFENKQNLIECDVKKKEVYFEVDLRMEVMFFDVTGEKIKKFVDPPALDIKLPYDFFYPFIKISNNNCSALSVSYYFALLCLILLYFCMN